MTLEHIKAGWCNTIVWNDNFVLNGTNSFIIVSIQIIWFYKNTVKKTHAFLQNEK